MCVDFGDLCFYCYYVDDLGFVLCIGVGVFLVGKFVIWYCVVFYFVFFDL